MRNIVKKWHRFIGIVVAVYLLIMSLTGVVLQFKHDIYKTFLPDLHITLTKQPDSGILASQVTALLDQYGHANVRAIMVPSPDLPAYSVINRQRERFLHNMHSLKPVDDPANLVPIINFIFDFHHRFAAGDFGDTMMGIMGLFTIGLLISGAYIWWPWRKGWTLKHVKPTSQKKSAYRISHAAVGIIAVGPLLILSLTGTGMMYSREVRGALTTIFGDSKPIHTLTSAVHGSSPNQLFSLASQQAPNAKISYYIPSKKGAAYDGLRLKTSTEWHPYGRSSINLSPQPSATYNFAPEFSLGHRMADSLYPLHSGQIGSRVWWYFILAGGIIGMYLCWLALKASLRKSRPSS